MKSENIKRLLSLCLGLLCFAVAMGPFWLDILITQTESRNSISHKYSDFIVLFWPSAIAIGIMSIKTARSVKFKVGVIWGRTGVGFTAFLSVFMFLTFVTTFTVGRVPRHRDMKILCTAMQQYCDQNKGVLPDAKVWCDQLIKSPGDPELFDKFLKTFSKWNPEFDNNASQYTFNKNLDGYRVSDIDRQTVLLFMTDLGWNRSGTSDILPPTSHPGCWPFIEGGYYFVLVGPDSNFTVEFIKDSIVDSINWTPSK